jgi:putative FmdB family regulatory protein
MPTYVYACDSCGAQFEQFQSFRDEPVRSCPRCSKDVRRVFQPVGIVFKGAGWYITDSRKSDTASVSSSSETKADSAPKAEGGETKAAAEPKPSETKTSSDTASTPA